MSRKISSNRCFFVISDGQSINDYACRDSDHYSSSSEDINSFDSDEEKEESLNNSPKFGLVLNEKRSMGKKLHDLVTRVLFSKL